MNRIDRLTAILIQLQSKKVVRAEEISKRFEISLRTVYRDVKALMEAGVPIGSEAGKGYFIVDGYHLPPVMLSQDEASAILLAGKLVERMTDHSVRNAFESALMKIKSVLNEADKEHLDFLQSHIEVRREPQARSEFPDNFLTDIQKATVNHEVLRLTYVNNNKEESVREVEPIGLFYYASAWHLIGWCRLRNNYRDFRSDHIKGLVNTGKKFENNNTLSLQDYFAQMMRTNQDLEKVVIRFDKEVGRYLGQQKYTYGFVSEEEAGHQIRMTFMTAYKRAIARWILTMGPSAEIESPEELKEMTAILAEEVYDHYAKYLPVSKD